MVRDGCVGSLGLTPAHPPFSTIPPLTGSPYTFLAAHAYDSLGGRKPIDDENTLLFVNGVALKTYRSHARFEDVNVLGADFLVRALATVALDYGGDTCIIHSAQEVPSTTAVPASAPHEEL